MNIFLILIMTIFMAGYYFLDAPNLSEPSAAEMRRDNETDAVLSCVIHAHSEAMATDKLGGDDFSSDLPCAEKYGITTIKLCADDKRLVKNCAPDKAGKFVANYIITRAEWSVGRDAGRILELLEKNYPYAANFGIISIADKVPFILSSGGARREVAKPIIKDAKFTDGELVYMTQYSLAFKRSLEATGLSEKIRCKSGETALFRQNQWTCVSLNIKPVCGGDYIWSSDLEQCVADNSRRPLCAANQTAVMTDGAWECADEASPADCPEGTSAAMNYDTMQWECQSLQKQTMSAGSLCGKIYESVSGGSGAAVRGKLLSCNDCERMVVYDDCTADCVPDPAAAENPACYSGRCSNFYFGFPDQKYISGARKNIPALRSGEIPVGAPYSRNRKFNCRECEHGINALASIAPYVLVCNP